MKGKKSSRSAFLTSLMSLVLCFAMLLGTTLAWFTDTASTGVNRIVAGNLDVEVEYSKNGTDWENIQGTTTLFSNNLWEPGHTEFVYLRVKNAGSLGLKYKVMVTPVTENGGINVNNEAFKLSKYLVFGTTAPNAVCPNYNGNRAAARADVGTTMGLNQAALTKESTIAANGAPEYLALVVYMPENVGNEANAKPGTTAPSIYLGITVVATQLNAEFDSFNNSYDEGASDPATGAAQYIAGPTYKYFPQVMKSQPVAQTGNTVIDAKGKLDIDDTSATEITLAKVTVPAAAALESGVTALTVKVAPTAATHEAAKTVIETVINRGGEAANFDIKVDGIDNNRNNQPIAVEVFVGKGLSDVKVYHNGVLITGATYNSESGYVTFSTTSFSDFTVTYAAAVAAIGTTTYGTVTGALNAAKAGDTVVLLKDIDTGAGSDYQGKTYGLVVSNIDKNVTINGNGYKVSGSSNYVLGLDQCTAAVTLQNITVEGTGDNNNAAINMTGCNNVVLENVKASGAKTGVIVNNSVAVIKGDKTEIANGAWHAVNVDNGDTYNPQSPKLTVEGGKIGTIAFERAGSGTIVGGTIDAVAAAASHTGAVTISGGTVNAVADLQGASGSICISGGTIGALNGMTISATGGKFTADPSACVAAGYRVVQDGQFYAVEPQTNMLDNQAWSQLGFHIVNSEKTYDGGKDTCVTDYQEIKLEGTPNLTIKGVTFLNGLTIYTDTNASGTVTLEDCVICLNDGTPNPGSNYGGYRGADYGLTIGAIGKQVKYNFKNCKFTAKAGHAYTNNNSYNVYIGGNYSADSVTFEGCTFERTGKHGIGCSFGYTEPGNAATNINTYYNLTVTGCNFKNWQNYNKYSKLNGAAIKGNVPQDILTQYNKTITISGNTFGEAKYGENTTATVSIDGWTGSWS